VALGRALIAVHRTREAATELAKVPAGSPREAQAAFLRARDFLEQRNVGLARQLGGQNIAGQQQGE